MAHLVEAHLAGRLELKRPRLEAGAKSSTVNRELAILRAMFYYGFEDFGDRPKISRVPQFPAELDEPKARSRFLTDEQYESLQKNCGHQWLRAMMAVAFTFGFRKGELLRLRVKQVNLKERTIALLPGETKNDKGRTVVMTDDVHALLQGCVRDKQADEFAFTWPNGKPVRDFRVAWNQMCKAAKVSVLLHDFRRTAVRNLIRAGVSRDVAKKISGHETDSIFSRYNITNEDDLADAAAKLQNRESMTISPELALGARKTDTLQIND
jgi:integrase